MQMEFLYKKHRPLHKKEITIKDYKIIKEKF